MIIKKKSLKVNLSIGLLFFILWSCSSDENNIIKKNSLTFKTGFEASYRFSGIFIEKSNKTEYLYFADPITAKCLKTFKLNGTLIDSVPFANALNFIGEVNGISVISRDTIILNSQITNLLVLINSKGQCIKKIYMDSLVNRNKKGDYFELSSSFLDKKTIGNSILFRAEWRYNHNESEPTDVIENLLFFNKKQYNSPYFCKINFNDKTTPVMFGLSNFYLNFTSSSSDYCNDVPLYTCVNNHLFLHTIYSNELFVINEKNLHIEKKIPITSRYTKIGATSFPINVSNIHKLQVIHDSIQSTSGRLFNFFYNTNNNKYYVFIYHAVAASLEKTIGYKKLPYSILSMDSSFSDFKEYNIESNTYFGAFSIMTSQGLIINTPSNNRNENNEYTRFTKFEF